MAILSALTSISEVQAGAFTQASTTAANLAPYVKEGLAFANTNSLGSNAPPMYIVPMPGVSEGGASFYMNFPDASIGGNWNHRVFEFRGENNTLLQIEKATNSTALTLIYATATGTASASVAMSAALLRIDVSYKIAADATGYINLYVDGTLLFSTTGANNFAGTVAKEIWLNYQCGTYVARTYSAFLFTDAADADTRGLTLVEDVPSGAGDINDFTGSYLDVDDLGYNDGAMMTSDGTAGKKSLFSFPALDAGLSALTPKAVILSTTAVVISGTVDGLVKSGGVEYPQAALPAALGDTTPAQQVYTLDPNTAATWTQAAINAAQLGYQTA